MRIKSKIFLSVALLLIIVPSFGWADDDFIPSGYLFFLYYDQGKLFANRDFAVPYDVTTASYEEPANLSENAFRGEILSFSGQVLGNFKFDPQNGQSNFQKGAITVPAPYFYNAKEVHFYNNLGDQLVVIDVAGQSFCNENKDCDNQESKETCPSDCFGGPTGVLEEEVGFDFVTLKVWARNLGIGLLAIIVLWLIVRRFNKKKNDLPPPTIQ